MKEYLPAIHAAVILALLMVSALVVAIMIGAIR
jgi:hypothetical protein